MAALSITATSVALNDSKQNLTVEVMQAGETLTPGIPVYLDASDTKVKKGNANTSSATATVYGITMGYAAADGDYVLVLKAGKFKVGATVVAGTTYYLDNTSGQIALHSDLVSTDYVTKLFIADSTSTGDLQIENSGYQI